MTPKRKNPTRAVIEQKKREIQSGWSEEEKWQRRGRPSKHWLPPIVRVSEESLRELEKEGE